MTKPELIDVVAKKTGMKKKDVATVLESVLDTVIQSAAKSEPVSLVGFGVFDVRKRAARMGRNPRTGAQIKIPASKSSVFRAGRKLRDAVS